MDEITIKVPPPPSARMVWIEAMNGLIFEEQSYDFEGMWFDESQLYDFHKSMHTNELYNLKKNKYEVFWVNGIEPAYIDSAIDNFDGEKKIRLEKIRAYLNSKYPDFEDRAIGLANNVYKKKELPLRNGYGSCPGGDFNEAMLIALTFLHQDLQHINQIYRILKNLKPSQKIHQSVCAYSSDNDPPFAFSWIRHCLCCYRKELAEKKPNFNWGGDDGMFSAPTP